MEDITARLARVTVSSPTEDVHITHQQLNHDNEAWIRARLIARKEPLVFIGESHNRSLPVALAIMRGSWDGIWAGSQTDAQAMRLSTMLESSAARSAENAQFLVQARNRRNGYAGFIHTGPRNGQKTAGDLRQTLSKLTETLDSQSRQAIVRRLSLVINAASLSAVFRPPAALHDRPPTRNIWFQCPWSNNPAMLIQEFMRSAAAVQHSGDAIFLGVTAHADYYKAYDLPGLKALARSLGYEIFVDECFIRHAIDAGYKHVGIRRQNIHDYILDYHQTFVFVKRNRREYVLALEDIRKRRTALEAYLVDLRSREEELALVEKTMRD
ncbi:hypothetical protein DFH09DRAFT_462626 [Mycena vulgaris]|nr:hypothetical protein DFH09DRAFT_462626 [Mycena vulgaris]